MLGSKSRASTILLDVISRDDKRVLLAFFDEQYVFESFSCYSVSAASPAWVGAYPPIDVFFVVREILIKGLHHRTNPANSSAAFDLDVAFSVGLASSANEVPKACVSPIDFCIAAETNEETIRLPIEWSAY